MKATMDIGLWRRAGVEPRSPKSPFGRALVVPVIAWLAGVAAFTMVAVEGLLPSDHFVFLVARVTAYVTATTLAAFLLLAVAVFGVVCGFVLRWLEDARRAPRAIAAHVGAAVGAAVWVWVACIWLGVLLAAVWAPAPLSLEEVLQAAPTTTHFEDELAFTWIIGSRFPALACFLACCAWRLARVANWRNACVAVACAVSAVAAVAAALTAIAGPAPQP